jgi:starch synthase
MEMRLSDYRHPRPTVAIIPWGDVIEDFLDPIGLSAGDFVEMTGGWLFGYVAALDSAGWRSIIICTSRTVEKPVRYEHVPTRTAIWMVPGRHAASSKPLSLQALERWWRVPLRSFRAVLAQESCSALIVQEYEDPRFDRFVRLGQAMRLPVFASFQGGDRTRSKLEAAVRRLSLSKATGLIIGSQHERRRVVSQYRRSYPAIYAIPNPVDVQEWRALPRAEARTSLGISLKTFVAINHGRIDMPRKGHDILLQAWPNDDSDSKLVIIGSGADDEVFQAMLARRGDTSIDWRRSYETSRSTLRLWLSAADVYVTTSRIEGMPVAPLEAMACGLPVVATNAQGLSELVGCGEDKAGFVVPLEDAEAVGAALIRLRSDDALRQRLARQARSRAERLFSLEHVGGSLAQMLETHLIATQ